MRQYSLSKRFVEGYLNKPYFWFLNRHSADLGTNILSEISQVVGDGMKPLMELIAKSMVALALIILLIIADPKLALIVAFLIGAAYGLIYKLTHNFLKRIGKERLKAMNYALQQSVKPLELLKRLKLMV